MATQEHKDPAYDVRSDSRNSVTSRKSLLDILFGAPVADADAHLSSGDRVHTMPERLRFFETCAFVFANF